MKYESTRGKAPILEFADVLLAGLASDGGLYVPTEFPRLTPADLRSFEEMSYSDVATRVLTPFVSPSIGEDDLAAMIEESYRTFRHPEVVPVQHIERIEPFPGFKTAAKERSCYLVELHWGPTFSFKDVALQLLGRLFEYELSRRDTGVMIVGATSGDTGSAAIEACRDRDGIELVMLHPRGRVSEIQRRQMTTITSSNIHNVAIDGTFDDCQDLVKAMFGDTEFRQKHRLAAVNSINWARVAAQTVYYFTSAAKILPIERHEFAERGQEEQISFIVPTGNFGNVFAGYVAAQMGLPIERLTIATNHNDILYRTFKRKEMVINDVVPSTSPAMDIQVSSNFERLLYYAMDKDSEWLDHAMRSFRSEGTLTLPKQVIDFLYQSFVAGRASEERVRWTIQSFFYNLGVIVDPHTAVALAVINDDYKVLRPGEELVKKGPPIAVMSTAHPAKFPDVVEKAIEGPFELTQPEELAALADKPERCTDLPNDLASVMDFVATASNQ